MNKQEVVKKYCELQRLVQEKRFNFNVAADCFCGENPCSGVGFSSDNRVFDFIEEAVREKLEHESHVNNVSVYKMVRAACKVLGRRVSRSRQEDLDAGLAVRHAAQECGLMGKVFGWMPSDTPNTMTELVQAYLKEYAETYGSIDGFMDISEHIGCNKPMLVETSD